MTATHYRQCEIVDWLHGARARSIATIAIAQLSDAELAEAPDDRARHAAVAALTHCLACHRGSPPLDNGDDVEEAPGWLREAIDLAAARAAVETRDALGRYQTD